MFTVKRFKFVSRQTLFNPIEFFAVVFLFSRHAGSSSTPFFFPLPLSLSLFSFPPQPPFIFIFFPLPLLSLSLSFFIPPPVRSDPIRSDPITGRKSDEKHYPRDNSIQKVEISIDPSARYAAIMRLDAFRVGTHPTPTPPLPSSPSRT